MSITKMTADVENIGTLSDYPNSTDGLTSTQLKAKFDKAGVDIKSYLNDTLTTEVDTNFQDIKNDIETNYATKSDLDELIAGQIPDGTLSESKFDATLQRTIDNVDLIEKYNELGNTYITKDSDGNYINNWTVGTIDKDSIKTNQAIKIKTPSDNAYQDGTHYFTNDGYKISGTADIKNAFDGDNSTSVSITNSDILVELPSAMDFTKISTYITGATTITIAGSGDNDIYTNLTVITDKDTALTEHTFSIHSEYKYYKITIVGTGIVKTISFTEDTAFPTDWLKGTNDGMITGATCSINGIETDSVLVSGQVYEMFYMGGKWVNINDNNGINNKFLEINDELSSFDKTKIIYLKNGAPTEKIIFDEKNQYLIKGIKKGNLYYTIDSNYNTIVTNNGTWQFNYKTGYLINCLTNASYDMCSSYINSNNYSSGIEYLGDNLLLVYYTYSEYLNEANYQTYYEYLKVYDMSTNSFLKQMSNSFFRTGDPTITHPVIIQKFIKDKQDGIFSTIFISGSNSAKDNVYVYKVDKSTKAITSIYTDSFSNTTYYSSNYVYCKSFLGSNSNIPFLSIKYEASGSYYYYYNSGSVTKSTTSSASDVNRLLLKTVPDVSTEKARILRYDSQIYIEKINNNSVITSSENNKAEALSQEIFKNGSFYQNIDGKSVNLYEGGTYEEMLLQTLNINCTSINGVTFDYTPSMLQENRYKYDKSSNMLLLLN